MKLSQDAEVTRKIAAGERHEYELTLAADSFVRIGVEQLGIDLAVALLDPAGEPVLEVDSPTGRRGTERLLSVVDKAGPYRVVVRTVEDGAPAGSYLLELEALRPAEPRDRERAAAERTFAEAEALLMAGDPDALRAAVERYREAHAKLEMLGERERQADALLRLGWAQTDLEERAAALASLEAARALYRELGRGAGEALALNSLGGIWIRMHENLEALSWVERALEIGRDIGNAFIEAEALNNLGILYTRVGKTDAAIDAYDEARELYEKLGEPHFQGRIRTNLGTLLLQQGKLEDAADHLREAAEIWQGIERPREAAIALSVLGDVRKREGELDEAVRNLEEALELRRQSDDRDGEGKTLNLLGTTHLLKQDFDRARECYEEARRIFDQGGNTQEQAVTLVNLGRLHVETGQPQQALELHREAQARIDEAGDPKLAASNHYGMAKAWHDLGAFEEARRALEETLSKTEDLRSATASEGLRIAFFAARQHYYELYIDVLMHLGEEEAALAAGDQRRARALLEALGGQVEGIRTHVSRELVEREGSLQAELNTLERRRVALLRQSASDENELDELRQHQRAVVLELEKVRGKLRREVIRVRPSSLAELQQLLGPATLLLAYSLGDERSFLFRVTHEGLESHVLPGREQIEAAVRSARRFLTERNPNPKLDYSRRQVLAQLGEILLGPVAAELDRQRLLIVAEGELLQLPFAALPGPPGMADPPDYLVRRHEIVSLPSASLLRTLRQRLAERAPAPKQLAIFADPVFVRDGTAEGRGRERGPRDDALERSIEAFGLPRLDPLPHTRAEAEAILEVARGECLEAFGYDATKKRILDGELGRYKIIHFATHGLVHREHPELSGLVLSLYDERGNPLDGFLRLHEIYNLELAAELVVLSACRTAGGRIVRGEGQLGLTRGFMHAGAPRLVVSLWNVSDRSTAELMRRFYWNLLEGEAPPALALASAQRSMLAEDAWKHPYDWAGFVFQGDWWPPGEEPPIGAARGGGETGDPSDPDYPGPGVDCEDLAEPWMRELCRLLRDAGER